MDELALENAIRASVDTLIKENNLDASIVGFEDYDYPRIRVEVAREDYQRVFEIDSLFDDYSIQWEQRMPPLVDAEVGDLVLVYSDNKSRDEDSDVGLVSSKFTDENGVVSYGCRYIKIGLNNRFVSDLYDFEITSEDYGGYPTGFLKVLTPQEAIDHLYRLLDKAVVKELSEVRERFSRSHKNLPALISSLSDTRKIQCERVELNEEHMPHSVKKD